MKGKEVILSCERQEKSWLSSCSSRKELLSVLEAERMSFLTSSVFNSSHDRIWKNVLAEEGKKGCRDEVSVCHFFLPLSFDA